MNISKIFMDKFKNLSDLFAHYYLDINTFLIV